MLTGLYQTVQSFGLFVYVVHLLFVEINELPHLPQRCCFSIHFFDSCFYIFATLRRLAAGAADTLAERRF